MGNIREISLVDALVILVKAFNLLCSQNANIYSIQWKETQALVYSLYIGSLIRGPLCSKMQQTPYLF